MADTAAEGGVYYSTSRSLGTGTTSTATLEIWRLLSNHLEKHGAPMSAEELSQATGMSVEQIDFIFSQKYYQEHYGFRRFESYEAWREWALAKGVLYNPEFHDAPQEEDAAGEAAAEAEAEGEE